MSRIILCVLLCYIRAHLHDGCGNALQCDTLFPCNTMQYFNTHSFVTQCNVTQYNTKKEEAFASPFPYAT